MGTGAPARANLHSPSITACECLIVGGGPAGAVLAALLARSGVHTVLVDDGRAHHSAPAETLLPAAAVALERAGCLQLVRAAAIADPLRHGAIWGSSEVRWQERVEGGLLLDRAVFDRRLRAQAAADGVEVLCPARALTDLGAATSGGLEIEAGGQLRRLHPRVLVVATGRRPLGNLLRTERADGGAPTSAVTLVGRADAADRGVAVVEAIADGWLWFLAQPDGTTSVVCLTDPPVRDHREPDRLHRLLAASAGPAGRLHDWSVRHGNDATARCVRTAADALLIGDAAATIDPLASQGVEKAVAAADHAAAVIRTMLAPSTDGPRRERLREQHRRWEHGLHRVHGAHAAAFYAAEQRFAEGPFWRARRRFGGETGMVGTSMEETGRPAPAADATLQLARGVEFVEGWRRVGETFEPCAGAQFGDEVITHLGFVPVDPLLRSFGEPRTIAQALAAAGRDARCFVLPPAAVLQALQELARRGWVRNAGRAPAGR